MRSNVVSQTPDLSSRDRAKVHQIRGIAHLQDSETGSLRHGKAELARTDLERAVELAPDVRPYKLMRAVAYYRTGEYDKAIADYDALMADSSTDRVGFLASRNRAAALIAMGKSDAAIAEYTSWIAPSNSPRPMARLGRCFAHAASNRLEEAMSDCDRVMRWQRGYYVFDARAYVYLKRAQYAEAIRDYDRVLQVRPDLVTSLYGRGLAKQGLGDSARRKTGYGRRPGPCPRRRRAHGQCARLAPAMGAAGSCSPAQRYQRSLVVTQRTTARFRYPNVCPKMKQDDSILDVIHAARFCGLVAHRT